MLKITQNYNGTDPWDWYDYSQWALQQQYYAALFSFVFGVIVIVSYVVCILLAVWVYNDAREKRMKHPELWVIVVILTAWVGLIVYLIIIRRAK